MEAQPIRILLVDDDASFLHSLEALLTGEPGLEIVGKAASGQEALAAAARTEPDVAVIDVLMPTMGGIERAQLLQERYPKARVILISGSIFEDKRPHRRARNRTPTWRRAKFPSVYTRRSWRSQPKQPPHRPVAQTPKPKRHPGGRRPRAEDVARRVLTSYSRTFPPSTLRASCAARRGSGRRPYSRTSAASSAAGLGRAGLEPRCLLAPVRRSASVA